MRGTVRTRLLLAFAVPMLLLLANLLVLGVTMRRVQDAVTGVTSVVEAREAALGGIDLIVELDLTARRLGENGAGASALEVTDVYWQELDAALARFAEHAERLALEPDALASLRGHVAQVQEERQAFEAAVRAGEPEPLLAASLFLGDELGGLSEALRALDLTLERQLALAIEAERRIRRQPVLLGAIGGALGVTGLALFAWTFAQRFVRPLFHLLAGVRDVARGDLTRRVSIGGAVETDSRNELAQLASAFNRMSESLRSLVARVSENVAAVAGVAAEVEEGTGRLRESAVLQEDAVEVAGGAVERINASLEQVGANVGTLEEAAQATSTSATQVEGAIGDIAGAVDRLSGVIDSVAGSIYQMSASIREITESASTLEDSTASATESLSGLSSMVEQTTQNARRSQELSTRASERSREGSQAVFQALEGMHDVQTSFDGLRRAVGTLAERSGSIGEIVGVIDGVVDETNLLALNAAIIAAQAGENGRPFAVVAEEVRNLAEQAAHSTREIEALVASVRSEVETAVVAVEQGGASVQRGVSLSKAAGDWLREITETSEESARTVAEITTASELQGSAIGRFSESMAELAQISRRLHQATSEQSRAGAHISEEMEKLRELGQQVGRSIQDQRRQGQSITEAVASIAERIREITRETNRQREEGARISQALSRVREAAAEGARSTDRMSSSVDSLSERSHGLEEEVGIFKL